MRYKNIFTGELVTKTGESESVMFEKKVIEYRRDTPVVGEFGNKMYAFSKPDYVFNMTYVQLNEFGLPPTPPPPPRPAYVGWYPTTSTTP